MTATATQHRSQTTENPQSQRKGRKSTSEARRNTARENGKKSRGPISDEGKAQSAQNAVKHGMTGSGTALPDEIQADYQNEIAQFHNDLGPEDLLEVRLLDQAALASVRWTHLMQADIAAATERTRRATADWDERRRAEVARWTSALEPESKSSDSPAEAVAQLKRTSDGCRHLAAAYHHIILAMDQAEGLPDELISRLARLLGLSNHTPSIACSATMRKVWSCLYAIRIEWRQSSTSDFASLFHLSQETAAKTLPPVDEAIEWLSGWLRRKRRAFSDRADMLAANFDEPDRASASAQSFFDPSPEAKLRHRYLVDANRMFRTSLNELFRLRKQRTSIPRTDSLPAETPETKRTRGTAQLITQQSVVAASAAPKMPITDKPSCMKNPGPPPVSPLQPKGTQDFAFYDAQSSFVPIMATPEPPGFALSA